MDISRRQALRIGAGGGALVLLGGFGPPACSVSKDKAVRYAGIAIDYLKEVLPIATQLGGTEFVGYVNKAIPALEKLKNALSNSDFPTAGSLFDTVKGVLSQVNVALMQLADTPRRTMIIGIVALTNLTLKTVELFVENETPAAAATATTSGPRRAIGSPLSTAKTPTAQSVIRAFELVRY